MCMPFVVYNLIEGGYLYLMALNSKKEFTNLVTKDETVKKTLDEQVDYYEENDELRVIDGNHRLTIYLNNGVKKIPTVLTKKAMNYLVNLK